MAIKSMTGFGSSEGESHDFGWTWQIKSVNGRGLDMRIRIPGMVDSLEIQVRKMISAALSRGNVTVSLELRQLAPDMAININQELLDKFQKIALNLAATKGMGPGGLER